MPHHSEIQVGRLLIDSAVDGPQSMAIDEALLESAAGGGPLTLRFYQWSEPTLSLGYFQRYEDRSLHPASLDCPIVRRQTGGGAILHDKELTYSLALPGWLARSRRAESWYNLVHGSLGRVLARVGISAEICSEQSHPGGNDKAFLCFERRTRSDVLAGGFKVCGSAQRRHRDAVLQHGSVLLARSERAPELAGLREIAGVGLEAEDLIAQWGVELESSLEVAFSPGALSVGELRAADRLVSEKYRTDRWNRRR